MVNKNHIFIILILIFFDQITKFYFKNKKFLIFNYTENTGAAFSLLEGYTLLLILISLIVIIATVFYYFKLKKSPKYLRLGLLFVFSGTIGNLIDRVSLGYVRDFIDLRVWPIFNFADIYNVTGFLIILYYYYKQNKK